MWGLSDDLNRIAIEENRQLVKDLGNRLNDLEGQLAKVRTSLSRIAEGNQRLEAVFDESRQEFLLENEGLLADFSEMRNAQQQQVTGVVELERLVSGVDTRVGELGEAVAVINQHRRQLSQRIISLERDLSSLQSSTPSDSSTQDPDPSAP